MKEPSVQTKTRKKRVVLPYKARIAMLKEYDSRNRSIAKIRRHYKIAEATFHNILKARNEGTHYVTEEEPPKPPRKQRVSPFLKLDNALVAWAKSKFRDHRNIEKVTLRERARKECAIILGLHRDGQICLTAKDLHQLQGFKASDHWAENWKKRHALHMRLTPLHKEAKELLGLEQTFSLHDLIVRKADPEIWAIRGLHIDDIAGKNLAYALRVSANCSKLDLSNNIITFNAFQSIC